MRFKRKYAMILVQDNQTIIILDFPNSIKIHKYGDYAMPTSIDTSVHFLAKKAKSRLSGRVEDTPSEYNKYAQKYEETYQKILKMATEEETVYNPISRFVGKDLKNIPNSSEKVRIVLETGRYIEEIKKRVRADLWKKVRQTEKVVVDDKEYDPMDLLRKLH